MSAIANAFAVCVAQGRGGFIPYITAGDPDLAATYDILLALEPRRSYRHRVGISLQRSHG